MSSTSLVNPVEVVRPLADGVVVLAAVSAMASIVTASAGAAGIGSAGAFAGSVSPYEELESLNKRISRLSYKLEALRVSVISKREHKVKLMHEYGFTVTPSVAEMKRYPKLRTTDYYLTKAEKDLDRMETQMTILQKRRKELQMKLGMRPSEEIGRKRAYPAMKKFVEPTRRDY